MKIIIFQGLKEFKNYKIFTVFIVLLLLLSVLFTAVGQMFLTTDSEKIIGRTIRNYGATQAFFYQGNGSDKPTVGNAFPQGATDLLEKYNVPYVFAEKHLPSLVTFETVIYVTTREEAEAVGFEFYEGTELELKKDSIYLSDFFVETYFGLDEQPDEEAYAAYIGREIDLGMFGDLPITLAGVFRTDWREYRTYSTELSDDWEKNYIHTEEKEGLSFSDSEKAFWVYKIMRSCLCSKELMLYGMGRFTVNENTSANSGKEADGSKFAVTVSGNRLGPDRYMDDLSFNVYLTDGIQDPEIYRTEPKAGEMVMSGELYERIFPEEAPFIEYAHVGETLTFTLRADDTGEVRAVYRAKLIEVAENSSSCFIECYKDDVGQLLSARTNNERGLYVYADIADRNLNLTGLLEELWRNYRVRTESIATYIIYRDTEYFQAPREIFVAITCVGVALFAATMVLLVVMLRRSVKTDGAENEKLLAGGKNPWEIRVVYLVKVFVITLISFALATALMAFVGWLVNCLFYMNFADPILWLGYDPITFIVSFGMSIVLPLLIALIPLRKIKSAVVKEKNHKN